MGWYRVVKTVKGRPYAYLQRSFRDGGRVRTESRYLGPAGSIGNDTVPVSHAPSGKAVAAPSIPPVADLPAVTAEPKRKRFVVIAPGVLLRFDAQARHIDPKRLGREYGRVKEWAQGLGVAPSDFPQIVMRDGARERTRRVWFGLDRIVTVPRKAGRKVARKAFGVALGQSFLDSVEKANPIALQVLASHLEPSFRTTNRLVLSALANDGERSRLALSLQIGLFGRIHPIAKLPAEHIGLVGYGTRGSWRDEAAGIIGEIATQGYRQASIARAKAHGEALSKERRARLAFERATTLDRITGKRRALGRKLVGATAARLATEEAHRKLHIIANLIPELAQ